MHVVLVGACMHQRTSAMLCAASCVLHIQMNMCLQIQEDKEHLLFFVGSARQERPEYSHGVRQTAINMFNSTPGVTPVLASRLLLYMLEIPLQGQRICSCARLPVIRHLKAGRCAGFLLLDRSEGADGLSRERVFQEMGR